MTRWSQVSGSGSANGYQARFDRLAAAGQDVHGEAAFCTRLVAPGARVLDAGCGTGRVAIELDRRGYTVVGVDVDAAMLDRARRTAGRTGSAVTWFQADLATLDPAALDLRALDAEDGFDLVLCAGNVIPLVAAGTEPAVLANLAAVLAPGGLLLTGFGLDADHLPLPEAPFGLVEYDTWCLDAGLSPVARYANWDGDPYADDGYVVSVHAKDSPDS